MTGLLAAFAVQTMLVYTDETALATPPLDSKALEGRALWLAHNCQTCHQIYGFGGFLGPDLTNAIQRLNRERLDMILTEGFGQMPAFGFDAHEIDAIEAYLVALDQTGIGQLRRVLPVSPAAAAEAIATQLIAEPLPDTAAAGKDTFERKCSTCHILFQSTPLGPFLAPDLSTVNKRLSAEQIQQILEFGRPDKGMPAPGMPDYKRRGLIEYIEWLGRNRAALAPGPAADDDGGDGDAGIPWFEFR